MSRTVLSPKHAARIPSWLSSWKTIPFLSRRNRSDAPPMPKPPSGRAVAASQDSHRALISSSPVDTTLKVVTERALRPAGHADGVRGTTSAVPAGVGDSTYREHWSGHGVVLLGRQERPRRLSFPPGAVTCSPTQPVKAAPAHSGRGRRGVLPPVPAPDVSPPRSGPPGAHRAGPRTPPRRCRPTA